MKRFIYAGVFALSISVMSCQENKEEEETVPEVVKTAFQKKYPGEMIRIGKRTIMATGNLILRKMEKNIVPTLMQMVPGLKPKTM